MFALNFTVSLTYSYEHSLETGAKDGRCANRSSMNVSTCGGPYNCLYLLSEAGFFMSVGLRNKWVSYISKILK